MKTDELQARLTALTAERDQLIQEANSRIAYLNGQIALLSELLAAPVTTAEAAADETVVESTN